MNHIFMKTGITNIQRKLIMRGEKARVFPVKVFKMRALRAGIAAAAAVIFLSRSSYCLDETTEQRRALPAVFNRNGALNIFEDKLEVLPPAQIVLQNAKREPKEKRKKEARSQKKNHPENFAEPVKTMPAAAVEAPEENLSPREKIFKKYGPPSTPHPVKAIDTAPEPYKAMLECLNINDQECAYQYAVKYVRYQRDLENTISAATAIEGQAMMAEDMLPAGSWPDRPEFQPYQWMRDIEIEEQKKPEPAENQQALLKEIDREVRALLQESKDAQHDLFNNRKPGAAIAEALDEKQERARARNLLRAKVPRDEQGKINVFFFMRPYDEDAAAMAGDIQKLYERSLSDKRINLVALVMDDFNEAQVNSYIEKTKVRFPIKPGMQAAKKFGVAISPTILFVTGGGKLHVEEGLRNFYYYDELLNLMQGR